MPATVAFYFPQHSISYCLLMWLELNDSHAPPQKHGKIDLNTKLQWAIFQLLDIYCKDCSTSFAFVLIVFMVRRMQKQVGFHLSPPKYQKLKTRITFPKILFSWKKQATSYRAFANERFFNEGFCLPETHRLVFALKCDNPSGYAT